MEDCRKGGYVGRDELSNIDEVNQDSGEVTIGRWSRIGERPDAPVPIAHSRSHSQMLPYTSSYSHAQCLCQMLPLPVPTRSHFQDPFAPILPTKMYTPI